MIFITFQYSCLCQTHHRREVCKRIKIHNLSDLPELACKGYFSGNNNKNKKNIGLFDGRGSGWGISCLQITNKYL